MSDEDYTERELTDEEIDELLNVVTNTDSSKLQGYIEEFTKERKDE